MKAQSGLQHLLKALYNTFVLCCFIETTYDVIIFLICIIQKQKRYSKKQNAILLYLEKPLK